MLAGVPIGTKWLYGAPRVTMTVLQAGWIVAAPSAGVVIRFARKQPDSGRRRARQVHPQHSAVQKLHFDGCVRKGQPVPWRLGSIKDLRLDRPPIWFKMQRDGKSKRSKCQHDDGCLGNSRAVESGADWRFVSGAFAPDARES